ncbi:FAD-dependent oxidoreductase [Candidatus Micrarchaeota archaeon]|nr:FAD-dependent oxidoreductase [Candidatus Micrarchaeota archaeon]
MVEKKLLKVLENQKATPTVDVLKLADETGNPFSFKPGQFGMLHVQENGGEVKRPYSFASSPNEKRFVEFCIKRVPKGRVSNLVCDLIVGRGLMVSGPYGVFRLRGNEKEIVFLASGTGIAPFKSMIESLFEQGSDKSIWLLFGIRNESEIIYRSFFENLAEQHSNFHFYPVLSDKELGDWKGERGFVSDAIDRVLPSLDEKEFYLCGVPVMVKSVNDFLLQKGVLKERIFMEQY